MIELKHKSERGNFELQINPNDIKRIYGENTDLNSEYIFIWNRGKTAKITIDNKDIIFEKNTILPIMHDQVFSIKTTKSLVFIKFNQDFYCIVNHDKEVGCVGFIFYGFQPIMPIKCDADFSKKLLFILQLIEEEFKLNEENKIEMLRALLARFIIEVTREAKKQYKPDNDSKYDSKFNLIRQFNLQVEIHFKKEHAIKFYAGKLNVSPKTIANYFNLYSNKTPQQIIHERLLSEAKRLLYYTEKSMKEISIELGFKSQTHFSKFYKEYTNSNPNKKV